VERLQERHEQQQQQHEIDLPCAKIDIEQQPALASPAADESAVQAIPLSAYLGLASAVIALSSIGPLLELETQVSSSMKITWRMLGTSLLMLPFAVMDVKRCGGLPSLTTPQWTTFIVSTICYTTMTL